MGPCVPSFRSHEPFHHPLEIALCALHHSQTQILGLRGGHRLGLEDLEVGLFYSSQQILVRLGVLLDPWLQSKGSVNVKTNHGKSLTWVCNTNSDVAALKLLAVESQGLFQSLQRSKLGVSESLGLHLKLVFDNSNIRAFTLDEEFGDIAHGGIKREIAKMNSVRWFVWKGELLADGISCKQLQLVLRLV